MSEPAAKQRYWVTFLLDDLPEGASFGVEALHLTVITWFVTDKFRDSEVAESFRRNFADLPCSVVTVGRVSELGGREVKVNLIEPSPELNLVHQRAIDWFESLEGRWAVKNPYMGEEYKPHIRRRKDTKLRAGDRLTLKSISLIKANRTEDWIRVVAAKVNLK